jgi:NAD(P)-dependent dehydrogenase (short-subunit alcohol dehydrogenase family)
MSQFAGKVVLITGGNAGIGRAAPLEFAKQGAQVVISARR